MIYLSPPIQAILYKLLLQAFLFLGMPFLYSQNVHGVGKTNTTPVFHTKSGFPYIHRIQQDHYEDTNHGVEETSYSITITIREYDLKDNVHLNMKNSELLVLDSTVAYQDNHYQKITFYITVHPEDQHVGDNIVPLFFIDTPGDTLTLYFPIQVSGVNDIPTAIIDTVYTAGAAAKAILQVNDPDHSLDEMHFLYTLLDHTGDTVFHDFTEESFIVFSPLVQGVSMHQETPPTDFFPYTLKVAARDPEGALQENTTETSFRVFIPDSLPLVANTWHMKTTLAPEHSITSIDDIFYQWADNEISDNILDKYLDAEAIDSLKQGQGYWIYLNSNKKWGVPRNAWRNSEVELHLVHGGTGWNQVGNPFPYPIQVDTTSLKFWRWDPIYSDLVSAHGILDPWEAYWVQVSQDTVITLQNEPHFHMPIARSFHKTSHSSSFQWKGLLKLQAGNLEDRSNQFGILQPGYSEYQEAEPPKIGSHISLYFTGSKMTANNRYSSDLRIHSEEEWFEIGVRSNETSQKMAQLTLEEVTPLQQQGYSTFLVKSQGTTITETTPLEHNTPVSIALSSQESRYHIVVTKETQPTLTSPKLIAAQNHPNPVRTSTLFQFTVPGLGHTQERTKITLWTYHGQYVTTLYQELLVPGSHSFTWTRPSSLQSGSYIYEISVGNQKIQKPLFIMP